jgi:hypothetical protein
LIAAGFASRSARAELADDVARLASAFRDAGSVAVLPPRIYTGGTEVAVPLPAAALDANARGCTTVMVLGATSTAFVLRLPGEGTAEDERLAVPSVAGGAEVVRCGTGRSALAELTIEMRSPRGVIETVVAISEEPRAALRTLLPAREPGAVVAGARPSSPLAPAPIEDRAAAVVRAFHEAGATEVSRRNTTADERGGGRLLLDLAPGCHRIAVLGAHGRDATDDIDAELAWADGTIASLDRSDDPDAMLLVCTGERQPAILAFAGSSGGAPLVLLHGRIALPEGLPTTWGATARARVARALAERHVKGPTEAPVYESLGVGGITHVPIELEPGTCYLAALSALQGDVKLVGLSADAGSTHSRAHTDDADSAAVLAFCVGGEDEGLLEAEVHGNGVAWIAALWPVSKRVLGVEAP